MHPLKKATLKELFPVISLFFAPRTIVESVPDHELNSLSNPTLSDRSHIDIKRYGKKGRYLGLSK